MKFTRCSNPLLVIAKTVSRVLLPVLLFVPHSSVAVYAQTLATLDGATSAIPLYPMTEVNEKEHLGYFGDPYPIHVSPWTAAFLPQYFSGTTQELMTCERPIKPGCFDPSPITVKIGDDLTASADNASNEFFDQINRNVYQTSDGQWNMAVTLYLRKKSAPKNTLEGTWTVIAHARPETQSTITTPTSWVVDKLLVHRARLQLCGLAACAQQSEWRV